MKKVREPCTLGHCVPETRCCWDWCLVAKTVDRLINLCCTTLSTYIHTQTFKYTFQFVTVDSWKSDFEKSISPCASVCSGNWYAWCPWKHIHKLHPRALPFTAECSEFVRLLSKTKTCAVRQIRQLGRRSVECLLAVFSAPPTPFHHRSREILRIRVVEMMRTPFG